MTISCYDKIKEAPKIVCFIGLIYMDYISYKKIFSYLKENYFFEPKVVQIDYEIALRKALIDENIFPNKLIL